MSKFLENDYASTNSEALKNKIDQLFKIKFEEQEIEKDGEKTVLLKAIVRSDGFYKINEELEKPENTDVKDFLSNVVSARLEFPMGSKETSDHHYKNLQTLCPNLEYIEIVNTDVTKKKPERFYDCSNFFASPEISYDKNRTFQGFSHRAAESINTAFKLAVEKGLVYNNGGKCLEMDEDREYISLRLNKSHLDKLDSEGLRIGGVPLEMQLLTLFKSAHEVSLEGHCPTSESVQQSLQKLQNLCPELRVLEIVDNTQNTPDKVDYSLLASFKKLESLSFPARRVSDFHFLNDMPSLREIGVEKYWHGDVDDNELALAENLPNMLSQMTDASWERIKKLNLSTCPMSQELFTKLCDNVSNLSDLSISIGGRGYSYIADFSPLADVGALEKLRIDNCSHLKGLNLKQLKSLSLSCSSSNPRIAKNIKELSPEAVPNLVDLDITGWKDTYWDNVFPKIAQFSGLKSLRLMAHSSSLMGMSYPVTVDDADNFGKLHNLEKLAIAGFYASDELEQEADDHKGYGVKKSNTFGYDLNKLLMKMKEELKHRGVKVVAAGPLQHEKEPIISLH